MGFKENKKLVRLGKKFGWAGTAFLISGQWTLEPVLYILGFIFIGVQVGIRKQWNLVALNLNGLAAWIMHLIR